MGGSDDGVHLFGRGLHRDLFPLFPGSGVDAPDWCCHRGSLHMSCRGVRPVVTVGPVRPGSGHPPGRSIY
ncbi:hypothetical protein STXM2123_1261 [Streptomyces sp. F-3]|nr:hypothetical protein STXM2123_1261 [Streptomyces sp. F-3]